MRFRRHFLLIHPVSSKGSADRVNISVLNTKYMSLYYLWYRETDGVSYPYHTVNIHCWLNNQSNYYLSILRVSVMVLTPLSTIFQLYRGSGQFYWWLEETILKRFILWNLFTPPYSWNIANVGVKYQPIHQSFLMLSLL